MYSPGPKSGIPKFFGWALNRANLNGSYDPNDGQAE